MQYLRPTSHYSDSLRAERSRDRIPVVARFSTPIQTCPETHSPYYILGTGSFLGQIDRAVALTPH
jgi:hypothetical protein